MNEDEKQNEGESGRKDGKKKMSTEDRMQDEGKAEEKTGTKRL